jgi:hypothetical protein
LVLVIYTSSWTSTPKRFIASSVSGEDNLLLINSKRVAKRYWSIPKNEGEVDLFFKIISKEFNS